MVELGWVMHMEVHHLQIMDFENPWFEFSGFFPIRFRGVTFLFPLATLEIEKIITSYFTIHFIKKHCIELSFTFCS